jgi:hypothetical protein
VTVARATPTRFFCPPESPPGRRDLEAREGHGGEAVGDARGELVLVGDPHAAQGEGDVLADGEVVEEGVVLEEHAEALAHALEGELVEAGERSRRR